jgi:hypothetical protein
MQDIVRDNRPARVAAPSSNVTVVGSGKVQDFDVGPKYRPYKPPPTEEEAPSERSGWREPTPLKPPPGVALVDQLVFQQDVADLEARGRQEAAAMGISLRDWVKLQMRERQAQKEKAAKDRKETPK